MMTIRRPTIVQNNEKHFGTCFLNLLMLWYLYLQKMQDESLFTCRNGSKEAAVSDRPGSG